jgi:hypothetical protein
LRTKKEYSPEHTALEAQLLTETRNDQQLVVEDDPGFIAHDCKAIALCKQYVRHRNFLLPRNVVNKEALSDPDQFRIRAEIPIRRAAPLTELRGGVGLV